jgi:ABC-type transporter Mla subunit MlaD
MSEEKPKLEDVEELLREAYERVDGARARIGAVVIDMNEAIERLEEGLKQNDKHMVDSAVEELKTLVKYLDRTVYEHILGAVVKVSEAGLKTAELIDEEREKTGKKQ